MGRVKNSAVKYFYQCGGGDEVFGRRLAYTVICTGVLVGRTDSVQYMYVHQVCSEMSRDN